MILHIDCQGSSVDKTPDTQAGGHGFEPCSGYTSFLDTNTLTISIGSFIHRIRVSPQNHATEVTFETLGVEEHILHRRALHDVHTLLTEETKLTGWL